MHDLSFHIIISTIITRACSQSELHTLISITFATTYLLSLTSHTLTPPIFTLAWFVIHYKVRSPEGLSTCHCLCKCKLMKTPARVASMTGGIQTAAMLEPT